MFVSPVGSHDPPSSLRATYHLHHTNHPSSSPVTPSRLPLHPLPANTRGYSQQPAQTTARMLGVHPLGIDNQTRAIATARALPHSYTHSGQRLVVTPPAQTGQSVRAPTPAARFQLHGIQPPVRLRFPLPAAFLQEHPVPDDEDLLGVPRPAAIKRDRSSQASKNPWDYLTYTEEIMWSDGYNDKENLAAAVSLTDRGTIRRRFNDSERDALETLYIVRRNPSKFDRQRLGAWLGV